MTIARQYVMQAAEGQADALAAALAALADSVRGLPGSLGVELLQDRADVSRFVFIEKWESVEAHVGAGDLLPKTMMAPVMAALGAPPAGACLDYLKAV